MKKIQKLFFLFSILSYNAFATGSFFCKEYVPETGNMIEDGILIYGNYSWSFGNALVGKVKLRMPNQEAVELDMSQYKNDGYELYYLSVMDIDNIAGLADENNQRIVQLKASLDDENESSFTGTLNVSYTHLNGLDLPIKCYAE